MKRIIILIAILFFAISCSDSDTNTVNVNNVILGKWQARDYTVYDTENNIVYHELLNSECPVSNITYEFNSNLTLNNYAQDGNCNIINASVALWEPLGNGKYKITYNPSDFENNIHYYEYTVNGNLLIEKEQLSQQTMITNYIRVN